MVRALLLAALFAFVPAVPGASTVPHSTGTARVVRPAVAEPRLATAAAVTVAWTWPLAPDPEVVQAFHAPPTPWSAGHRGVDLAADVGQPVLSAGRGRVTFSGIVAGRGVVVVTHTAGLRTSYEPVDARAAVGTLVAAGDPVGVISAVAGHCAPAACLHWGLRRGATYLDPLLLVGSGPPVLLPLSPP
jgi:murein DD-endopeptidase MepM/ murein hydrolase activator NlpD